MLMGDFAAILGFSVREVIDMRWREVLERDLPALTAPEGNAA
jgi:hypothetical protein